MSEIDFIHINQVTKNFKDPASEIYFQALRGIDLNLNTGSFTAIIGPSGAGKSTLLNLLGGMMRPSTGAIFVDGMPLHTLNESGLEYYRRYVAGFLWQIPERNLLPGITALDNIMFAMESSGLTKSVRKKRAIELLESVGLASRMGHKLGQLSGGEAQRASLCVALANEPKLLLADEPTGELDSETTMEIIGYLRELNKDLGLTICVVTHDTRFERMTTESYNILDGSIAGVRRSISEGSDENSWKDVIREEVSVINQFGLVRIPNQLRQRYNLTKFVRFVEDSENGRLYLEPVNEV